MSIPQIALMKVRESLNMIVRRATEHPDDSDADRKRNLFHVLHHAKQAIAAIDSLKGEAND